MTSRLFRRARLEELPTVLALLERRRDWLAGRGLSQWARDLLPDAERAVQARQAWLLLEGDQAVGTVSLSTRADPDFWTQSEREDPAIYLSKCATDVDQAGRGIGALLIQAAARYASDRGIARVRWDVWRTNERLQRYYRSQGATHLRTVDRAGRHSGALFQIAHQGTSAVTIDAPRTTLGFLPTVAITTQDTGAPITGAIAGIGASVTLYAVPDIHDGQPLYPGTTGLLLSDAGDGWHAGGHAVSWPSTFPPIISGHPYRVALDGHQVVLVGDQPPLTQEQT